MKTLLLKDSRAGTLGYYEDILEAAQAAAHPRPDYGSGGLRGFYTHLILALLAGDEITIADFNFPELTIESVPSSQAPPVFDSIASLIAQVRNSRSVLHLYTSGSSGQPKRVTHQVQKLMKMTRIGANYQNHVWALAYNATHMAGLQVFFQAFLNQNPIINIFGYSTAAIFRELEAEQVTHLSATPTFYRLLLPLPQSYPTLQRLTLGGERSSPQLCQQLQATFPNARINNIYATTESGTLLVSEGAYFKIPAALKEKVKVEEDELWVHQSLLARSEARPPAHSWYATGDRIRWVDDDAFYFTGRTSAVVNVAGYRVDLEEIADKVREIEGIRHCQVFARPNSLTGHIVCCDLLAADVQLEVRQIKKMLAKELPAYKVPRIIRFVDQLAMSRRGKINTL